MVISDNNNNNTMSRWTKNIQEETEKNNQWTEVVSKKKQHPVFTEGRDPFAGMKSSVDYEQEIERLKQLVPKQPIEPYKKKLHTTEKKPHHFNTTFNHHIKSTTTTTHHHHHYNNNNSHQHHQPQQQLHYSNNNNSNYHHSNLISRSTSPDTIHSSSSSSCDSDTSSLSDQYVSEQDKLRFLAFVRSWTGDCQKGVSLQDFYSSTGSLWADPSPWNGQLNKIQTLQPEYSYWKPQLPMSRLPPIGVGRKSNHF